MGRINGESSCTEDSNPFLKHLQPFWTGEPNCDLDPSSLRGHYRFGLICNEQILDFMTSSLSRGVVDAACI